MSKLRQSNKLYNEKIAEERREQRAREKEERERVRAKKAKEAAERKAYRVRARNARIRVMRRTLKTPLLSQLYYNTTQWDYKKRLQSVLLLHLEMRFHGLK